MKNIKEEKLIPPQKDKSHQQLVKENWDEADKIFMKALMEPVDEELYKELTSNENNQKEKETK